MKKMPRTLVVEDDKFDRNFLEGVLRAKTGQLKLVSSAKEALRIPGGLKQFDLFVVDMMMPGMNGMELIATLRKGLKINQSIMMYTAVDPSKKDVDNAREFGVNVFLRKNYSGKILTQAIDLALALNGLPGVVFLKETEDDVVKCLVPIEITKGRHGYIEIVILSKENSVCLSSQTGCRMGCQFCMTGQKLSRFVRNLTFEEMNLSYRVAKTVSGFAEKKVDVLFEGMGEPLLNLENVVKLAERLDEGDTFRISTMVPSIKLFRNFTNIFGESEDAISRMSQLQISLHFSNRILRGQHMRVARRMQIEKMLGMASKFSLWMGTEVCLNYAVFKGINDYTENIQELAKLLIKYDQMKLRLTMANPLGVYGPVSEDRMMDIRGRLVASGISPSRIKDIFISQGRKDGAACGQLGSEERYRYDGGVSCEYGGIHYLAG